jgi:hypothetical protein
MGHNHGREDKKEGGLRGYGSSLWTSQKNGSGRSYLGDGIGGASWKMDFWIELMKDAYLGNVGSCFYEVNITRDV